MPLIVYNSLPEMHIPLSFSITGNGGAMYLKLKLRGNQFDGKLSVVIPQM